MGTLMGGFNQNPAADRESQNQSNLAFRQAQVNAPQMPGNNVPTAPGALAPQPGGLRGTLSRILYGMGQSGLRAAGMPTDIEMQNMALQRQAMGAQIQQTQANTQN